MFYLITDSALSPSQPDVHYIGVSVSDNNYVYEIRVGAISEANKIASGIPFYRVTRDRPELIPVANVPKMPDALPACHFGTM